MIIRVRHLSTFHLVLLFTCVVGIAWGSACAPRIRGVRSASSINCPSYFTAISANSTFAVNSAFCVSKYEMKIQGLSDGNQVYNASYVAESRPDGTPWVNV